MAIDISHLVVIGCSLAYCQGLESPQTQGWPALVANKLGVPVVNLSGKGAGNDKIMRRLFEYHNLNSPYGNNPFYIISFSHANRREEYMEHKKDYAIVDMHPDAAYSEHEDFSRPCLINYHQGVLSRRKLMLQSYILSFLKQNNLNYVTTDYLPDHHSDIDEYIKPILSNIYEEVYSDKYRMRNLIEISDKYPRLPCMHASLEAHEPLANYVSSKIIELYGDVKYTEQQYVKLVDYAEHYKMCGILDRIELDWF